MLEYNRIDAPEGIQVYKADGSVESIICHYWYFLLNINLKFQPEVCNSCYCLMLKAMNFNDVIVVTVKWNDYRIHFLYISKDEAINV